MSTKPQPHRDDAKKNTMRLVHAKPAIFSFHLFTSFIPLFSMCQDDSTSYISFPMHLFTVYTINTNSTDTQTSLTHSFTHAHILNTYFIWIVIFKERCADAFKSWILGCYTNLLFILAFHP